MIASKIDSIGNPSELTHRRREQTYAIKSAYGLSSCLKGGPVMMYRRNFVIGVLLVVVTSGGCSTADSASNSQLSASEKHSSYLPNPASVNCVKKGGKVAIEKRGDGGEYGICLFEDNRQCEEWAMLRGNCPVGGIKVSGYVTPASQYCAITGGEYTVTANSNRENEQGTCTFKNGIKCDVWEYYDGRCSPNK
jgi:putative hemolysin